MDFLNTVRQKLQELEEQARLMEAQAQNAARPQGELRQQPRPPQRAQHGSKGAKNKTSGRRQAAHLPSREPFQTPPCPTAKGSSTQPATSPPVAGRLRLVDDLHGRLDEAFLLSEILGPPRCLRDWED